MGETFYIIGEVITTLWTTISKCLWAKVETTLLQVIFIQRVAGSWCPKMYYTNKRLHYWRTKYYLTMIFLDGILGAFRRMDLLILIIFAKGSVNHSVSWLPKQSMQILLFPWHLYLWCDVLQLAGWFSPSRIFQFLRTTRSRLIWWIAALS